MPVGKCVFLRLQNYIINRLNELKKIIIDGLASETTNWPFVFHNSIQAPDFVGFLSPIKRKFLWFNGLLGSFIFTIVNLKKRPAITQSASYSMGSCPLA